MNTYELFVLQKLYTGITYKVLSKTSSLVFRRFVFT